MQEAVGAAIRARREARGWTQDELGRQAQIDKGTVSRIERGANVTIDTLLMITRALDATLVLSVETSESRTTLRDGADQAADALAGPSEEKLRSPGKELVDVPTPVHRAAIAALALLSDVEVEALGLLGAVERTRKTRRERKDPPDRAAEGHSSR